MIKKLPIFLAVSMFSLFAYLYLHEVDTYEEPDFGFCDSYKMSMNLINQGFNPLDLVPQIYAAKGACLSNHGNITDAKQYLLYASIFGDDLGGLTYAETLLRSAKNEGEILQALAIWGLYLNSSNEYTKANALTALGVYFSMTKRPVVPPLLEIAQVRELGIKYLKQAAEYEIGFAALYALSSIQTLGYTDTDRARLRELADEKQLKHVGTIQISCDEMLKMHREFGAFDLNIVDMRCN